MANPLAQTVLSAVDKTQGAFNSVNKNLKTMEDRALALNSVFARFLPLLGAATITNFGKNIIDAADGMNDLSLRTGISIDRIAAWDVATKQSGTSVDALASALGKGSKYLVEHADELKKLGINAKTSEELIFQLSDVISRLPADDPRRVALAMQVLGKSAGELLPLLSLGGDELRRMVKEGSGLAKVMKDLGPEADEFNDNLAQLKANAQIAGAKTFLPLVRLFNQFSKESAQASGYLEGVWVRLKAIATTNPLILAYSLLWGDASKNTKKSADATADHTKKTKEMKAELAALNLQLKSQGDELAKTQQAQVLEAYRKNVDEIKKQISGFQDLGKAMQTAFTDAGASAADALAKADQFLKRASSIRQSAQDRISDIDLKGQSAEDQDAVRNQQIQDALDKAQSARIKADYQRLQGNTQEAERQLQISEEQAQRADDITGKLNDEDLARQRILEAAEAQARVEESRAEVQKKIAEEEVARQESLRQQMAANDQTITDLTARLDQLNAKVQALSNAEANVKITTDREAYDQTLAQIQVLEAKLANLAKGVNVPVRMAQNGAAVSQDQFESAGNFAGGGVIPGRSPHSRADDKLIWATSGEGMVNIPAMQYYGGAAWLNAINKRKLPRYADGGVIGRVSVPAAQLGSRSSGDVINLTLPNIGTFPVTADKSVSQSLQRGLRIEALKRGSRN